MNKSIKELERNVSFWSNTAQSHLTNLQLAQAEIERLKALKQSDTKNKFFCSNCKANISNEQISISTKQQLESELNYWQNEVGLEQYLANCKQGYLNIIKELKEKLKE